MALDEPDLLSLLAEHELAIKNLYETFAGAFASHRDFWQNLANEEQHHADRLGTLREAPVPDAPQIIGSGIRPQAVRSSIKYVESQAARARAGALSLVQALAIARDLEHSLIEEHYFRVRDTGHAAVRSVMTGLAEDTRRHRDSLAEALKAERLARP